jgi:hypothetical protein
MLNCLEIIAPQLKLLPEITIVYSKGIHAYENLEQSFSPYSRQISAIKYMYGSLKFIVAYYPLIRFVNLFSSFPHEAINQLVSWNS